MSLAGCHSLRGVEILCSAGRIPRPTPAQCLTICDFQITGIAVSSLAASNESLPKSSTEIVVEWFRSTRERVTDFKVKSAQALSVDMNDI